jgi:hypothetical protein
MALSFPRQLIRSVLPTSFRYKKQRRLFQKNNNNEGTKCKRRVTSPSPRGKFKGHSISVPPVKSLLLQSAFGTDACTYPLTKCWPLPLRKKKRKRKDFFEIK